MITIIRITIYILFAYIALKQNENLAFVYLAMAAGAIEILTEFCRIHRESAKEISKKYNELRKKYDEMELNKQRR